MTLPARRRKWFIVAGIILLLALLGVRVVGGLVGPDRDLSRTGLESESDAGREGDSGDGTGSIGEGGGRAQTDADDAGVIDPDDPANVDPDTVPLALVYQLVDQLRDAGIGPVESTDVVVEYESAERSAIVMRGEFENTRAGEIRFERRNGTWVLAEGSD